MGNIPTFPDLFSRLWRENKLVRAGIYSDGIKAHMSALHEGPENLSDQILSQPTPSISTLRSEVTALVMVEQIFSGTSAACFEVHQYLHVLYSHSTPTGVNMLSCFKCYSFLWWPGAP